MVWKKIDDYCGSVYIAEQPYSSFVAQGLTTNANAYPESLTRSATVPFDLISPLKWSAYGEPLGFIVYVNCGLNAQSVKFTLAYKSATANQVGGSFGEITVIQLSTNSTRVPVPLGASTGGTTKEFTMAIEPVASGFQAFWIGFQSKVLVSKGTIDVLGAINNQFLLSELGGGGGYQLVQGEKAEVLEITNASIGTYGTTYYQIGLVDGIIAGPPDQGIATVFPYVITEPPVTPAFNGQKQADGEVFELGQLQPISLTYQIVDTTPLNCPDQFSHYNSNSLTAVNNAQGTAIKLLRTEIANTCSSPYRAGVIVQSSAPAYFTFAVETTFDAEVEVVFYAMRLADESPAFTFAILNKTGAVLATATQTTGLSRVINSTGYGYPPLSMRAYAQASNTVGNEWGMRDLHPKTDISKLALVYYKFEALTLTNVNTASDVYTLVVTSDSPVYICGLSARYA